MRPNRSDLPTYRWQPIADADVPAWTELVNHLADVDQTEEYYREQDLREDLARAGVDPEQDTLAVWDGEKMIGFGQVRVPLTADNEGNGRGYLGGGVREGYRGQGLGRELMDRLEPRAEQLVTQRHGGSGAPYLRAGGGRPGSGAQAMLEHRGYRVVRWYNELERPLDGRVTVPGPDGVVLRAPREDDEEAVRLAHNDAFRDHWGSGPSSPEGWHDTWTGSSARGDVSTLAVDEGTGEVLAYVLCSEYVDRELYVELVGTRREARGRGLAQAALLRTIDEATRDGRWDVIQLGVDSQNPSGATRLYERVGFAHKLQTTSLQRALPLG